MATTNNRLTAHFENADIIFVDPCYIVKDGDIWETYCEDFSANKNLDKLGCSQGICLHVGDVYPEVLADENTEEILGEICSDSNNIACLNLDEVLAYNPDFADDLDSGIVIRNFTGEVIFETVETSYYDEVLPITSIIGIGSTPFHSAFFDDDENLHFQPDCFTD